jgi:hypothetical protein
MTSEPFRQRVARAVRKSVYRRRESELAILLAALRIVRSRALLSAVRQVLGSKPR